MQADVGVGGGLDPAPGEQGVDVGDVHGDHVDPLLSEPGGQAVTIPGAVAKLDGEAEVAQLAGQGGDPVAGGPGTVCRLGKLAQQPGQLLAAGQSLDGKAEAGQVQGAAL